VLRHVGRSTPLVVVFTALCCGIFIRFLDKNGIIFTLAFLVLLVSRKRIVPALIGLFMGFCAAASAPAWIDVTETRHFLTGTVQAVYRVNGMPRILFRSVTLDAKKIKGLVQLNVYRQLPEMAEGSKVSTTFTGTSNKGFGNTGEFNYRLNLLGKGIVLTGKIEEDDRFTIKEWKKISGLKSEINKALSHLASPESEIMKAMLTGDISGISYSMQDRFNSLGISHLIAISGLNMAIIFCMGHILAFSFLRILAPLSLKLDSPLWSKVFGILCVICYALFIGPIIPSMRAAIMAVCAAGYFIHRKSNLLENLAAAGILILVIWPYSIYSVSFLLTFAAVLAILGVMNQDHKIKDYQMIMIPVIIATFTIPITNYIFGFVSWPGIIVNIILVPLFSLVVMPLCLVGLVIFSFSQDFALYLFSLAIESIRTIFFMSDKFGMLHVVPRPSISWVYASYLGLVLAFFGDRTKTRLITIALILVFLLADPVIRHQERLNAPLSFDFISVGQGDSILISKKSHAILIDAGPNQRGFDCGRSIIVPHLLRRGITSLDLLVMTHAHPDHIGGVPFILQNFPVRRVWVNSLRNRNRYFQEAIEITNKKSIPVKEVTCGDKAHIGDIRLFVLNPPRNADLHGSKMDQNMQSIVLLAGEENMKGLFMGDAEFFGELVVLHSGQDISADVLKVAHHGSSRSCLELFLEAVNPKIAVISCGRNNRYGSPSMEAVSRLQGRGIAIYRTDLHGEINITPALSPDDYNIKLGRRLTDNQ
jgi:competence protein ComEC